ncbi:MAG: VacJ family lipoprotein [Desulfovibrio sp.]|jgi:phospholipid-binding lipoprotein MlaA|nr:VacJ family lipoprotein [Desulfovibrio sp.]
MCKMPILVFFAALLLTLAGPAGGEAFCATADKGTEDRKAPNGHIPSLDDDDAYLDRAEEIIADPIEGFNRAVFEFNDVILEHVGRPMYEAYAFVTPEFMRDGLANFFHNLDFPVRFANNLLQGRPLAAGVEMSRFILNTTAGLGGFFDVAGGLESAVPVEDEDMGQTLGVWGVGEGFYIVWPFAGPKTLRDSVGWGVDQVFSPTTYLQPWELSLGVWGIEVFNNLDRVLDLYDNLKQGAVEPYASVRDAYVQYRRAKIPK